MPPTPLADRLDFEIARAIEWRDGELRPLPDTAPGPRTGADRAALPGDLAIARARRVLGRSGATPGALTTRLLGGLLLVASVMTALAGAQLARTLLGEPGSGPVNITWFVTYALIVPGLFLVASLCLFLPSRLGLGLVRGLFGDLASVGSLLLAGAVRFVLRWSGLHQHAKATGANARATLERLHQLVALRPLLFAASQTIWCAYHVGFLVIAAVTLSAQHHTFGWQSTFISEPATATRILRTVTAPAALFGSEPASRSQVEASRFLPDSRQFATDLADPGRALMLRQAWSGQLLAAVVVFGVAPRLGLGLMGLLAWSLTRRRLRPDDDEPYVAAVVGLLLPAVTTATRAAAPATESEPSPPPPATPSTRSVPASPEWHLAAYLSAAPGQDPVATLFGAGRADVRSLGRLDSRASERDAVDRLAGMTQPRGLVLIADYAHTPDAALVRLIGRLRDALEGGPLRVVLSGGETFRRTRLGATADGVERRRAVWLEVLGKAGCQPSDVHDFDTAAATAAARSTLAAWLGLPGDAPPARDHFAAALDDLARAAPGWLEELDAVQPDRLAALQLRLAAKARRAVDASFEVGDDAGPRAASAAAGVLKTALGRVVDAGHGLPGDALEVAARSVGGMWGLLLKARDMDPRFVVAGLTAGLVAGPLGGAIAAGSAGLIAGASLMTTLGTLGGALGGALSLKRGRSGAPDPASSDTDTSDTDTADSRDRLGLPLRTGVTRAIVLRRQGQSEPDIARAIARLAADPRSVAPIDDAGSAAALLDAARELEATP